MILNGILYDTNQDWIQEVVNNIYSAQENFKELF